MQGGFHKLSEYYRHRLVLGHRWAVVFFAVFTAAALAAYFLCGIVAGIVAFAAEGVLVVLYILSVLAGRANIRRQEMLEQAAEQARIARRGEEIRTEENP